MLFRLSEWFLYAGMAGVVVFTVLFGLRSRWWAYPEGRALMAKSASLAGITSLTVLYYLLGPDYPGREWVRLGVYGFFFASQWWLVVVLLRRQWSKRVRTRQLRAELAEAHRREARNNRDDQA